jgi:hypothetical protein
MHQDICVCVCVTNVVNMNSVLLQKTDSVMLTKKKHPFFSSIEINLSLWNTISLKPTQGLFSVYASQLVHRVITVKFLVATYLFTVVYKFICIKPY